MKLLLCVCSLTFLSSCLYRMPGPDDVHTVPITNNPAIYRDSPSMPGVGL